MCGIIGYRPLTDDPDQKGAFASLFKESAIRGLHAFGIGTSESVKRSHNTQDIIDAFNPDLTTVAHARYCTSGDWHTLENNQPIVVDDIILAFNGVIHMGSKEEFEKAFNVKCDSDNDGEVFLRRMIGGETAEAFLSRISGSFAGVWLRNGKLWAGRNARRPLWKCQSYGALWYGSTRDVFLRAGFPLPVELVVGVELCL
jgi:asparagine synthetase B (glutamine-hydrolysing)